MKQNKKQQVQKVPLQFSTSSLHEDAEGSWEGAAPSGPHRSCSNCYTACWWEHEQDHRRTAAQCIYSSTALVLYWSIFHLDTLNVYDAYVSSSAAAALKRFTH